ncbi:phosphatase PAP2 family protein [Telmatospirillum sp.]|uniref:phosphatase PAP2 family protein n=1 Tax=Telmatospirillum sp. TaxID=2079197 RepID=UPI002843893B|nr:phosphatase PAP2 family protein [Telmatospirillum sp.]MDR3435202.1 phosphatase PAP2 family protein [Telmatospirillum sp.]
MSLIARNLRFIVVFLLFLLAARPGLAAAGEFHYVTTATVDLTLLLAPPPAPDSPAERADLDTVIAASKSRSAAEAEGALADGTISVLRFADVLGEGFSVDRLPFALPLFAQVASDTHGIVASAKVGFDRLRPSVVDNRVALLRKDVEAGGAQHHRSGSYPSGHATFAYVSAVLLAGMVPEKASEIYGRAADYAHNRLIAGTHYPTDIDAGRIAGTVIANVLLHDPVFLDAYAKARVEVRHALALE